MFEEHMREINLLLDLSCGNKNCDIRALHELMESRFCFSWSGILIIERKKWLYFINL